MPDPIVITGMGIVSPIGVGEAEFWAALAGGHSGAAPIDCLDTSDLTRRIGCQVKQKSENLESSGVKRKGRAADLTGRAAAQAIRSASFGARVDPRRAEVIVGTTMGETEFIENRLSAQAGDWLSPQHVEEILGGRPGSIAEEVARQCGFGGGMDLYGACAAGNMAIEAARRRLLDGRSDFVLAGGADGFSRLAFIGFMRLRVMATEVCRPFDVDRDGLFVGEGAAMFLLERESSAKARGARVRARVLGAGNACENYHPTRPHPQGDGLSRAIASALDDAALAPADVGYVCAHGTGTPQNDAIELEVMNRMFPERTPFSSIKALTGHTMGAAAAIEAAACILMLEHQTLIPTWHLANVQQPCALDALRREPRTMSLKVAINNSAGFGGYNSSVVLGAA